jgi:hypothetical protein
MEIDGNNDLVHILIFLFIITHYTEELIVFLSMHRK